MSNSAATTKGGDSNGNSRDSSHIHLHLNAHHTLHPSHRDELARVRDVMRAQQCEFQSQVAELHRLLAMQRTIVRSMSETREDLVAEIVDAYCQLPTSRPFQDG